MGKNKSNKWNAPGEKGKTQELEEQKRIPEGYFKNNLKKSK